MAESDPREYRGGVREPRDFTHRTVHRRRRRQQRSGGRLQVSRAHTLMDAEGELADDATRKLLGEFVQGFARFIQA